MPLRVLLLGKVPPVEGGVSAQTFWLARALARQGHHVDVVTNAAEVEPTLALVRYGDDDALLHAECAPGELRFHQTTPLPYGSFTPFAQPYASKLFGLALAIAARKAPDVVLSWYLEPYGLVAALVGQATGLPVVIRHAGSDLGRLARHPDLREAHRWALSRAAGIVATQEKELDALYGPIDSPRLPIVRPRLPVVFAGRVVPLDVDDLLQAGQAWLDAARVPRALRRRSGEAVPGAIRIGVYGKVGLTKGSFDLIAALSRLAADGAPFSFLSLSCGRPEALAGYYEAICASPELVRRTIVLPPVMPWRIPGFLAGCDIVCFLERDFPIAFHGPLVPREILSSGACLVCSGEIARKPLYQGSLVDDRTAAVIDDPRDHGTLAARLRRFVENPRTAEAIGRQGQLLAQFWEDDLPSHDAAVARFAEAVVARVTDRTPTGH